jgi:hypothetical protein
MAAGRGEQAVDGLEGCGPVTEADRPPDLDEEESYWAKVPGFLRAREEHRQRWPADGRPASADGSADPPKSDRGEEGFGERRTEITDAISDVRKAEPGLSADAQRVGRENACGGWLEGFDRRLKDENRLMEKVAEVVRFEPSITGREALREVPDVIRYTFCLQPEQYKSGYYDIKARLERCDYEMYYSKNWWDHPEYKGVNTRWVTQEGQRFEVQFHTPESFHAKHHVTHDAYERIRNPLTNRSELLELHAFQREVSSSIPIPDGAKEIPDYEKEGF